MWETISPYGGGPTGGSWDHGWSSGAAPALTNYALGVQPTSPGFATFSVTPHPDGLQWARGTVPTPHGEIRVSWRLVGGRPVVHVYAPPGTTFVARRMSVIPSRTLRSTCTVLGSAATCSLKRTIGPSPSST